MLAGARRKCCFAPDDDAQGPDVAGAVRFHLRLHALVSTPDPSRLLTTSNPFVAKHTAMR